MADDGLKAAPRGTVTPFGAPLPSGTRSPGTSFNAPPASVFEVSPCTLQRTANLGLSSTAHAFRRCTDSRHRPATPFDEGRPAFGLAHLSAAGPAFRSSPCLSAWGLTSNPAHLSVRQGPDRSLSDVLSTPGTTSEPRCASHFRGRTTNSATRSNGTPLGVPAHRSGRSPAFHSQDRGASHCGRRQGARADQPKLRHAIPCCCPAFRRASRGRPLTAPRIPGPRLKGRRPAVYTSRCAALSVFRVTPVPSSYRPAPDQAP